MQKSTLNEARSKRVAAVVAAAANYADYEKTLVTRPCYTTCIRKDGTMTKFLTSLQQARSESDGEEEVDKSDAEGETIVGSPNYGSRVSEPRRKRLVNEKGHPVPGRHLPTSIDLKQEPEGFSSQFRHQAIKDVKARQAESLESWGMTPEWFQEKRNQEEEDELIADLAEMHDDIPLDELYAMLKRKNRVGGHDIRGIRTKRRVKRENISVEDDQSSVSRKHARNTKRGGISARAYLQTMQSMAELEEEETDSEDEDSEDAGSSKDAGTGSKEIVKGKRLAKKPQELQEKIMNRRRNALRDPSGRKSGSKAPKEEPPELDDVRTFEEKAQLLAFYVGVGEHAKNFSHFCRHFLAYTESLKYKTACLTVTESNAMENIQRITERDMEQTFLRLQESCQPLVELCRKSAVSEKTELAPLAEDIFQNSDNIDQSRNHYDATVIQTDLWAHKLQKSVLEALKIAAKEFKRLRAEMKEVTEAMLQHKVLYDEYVKKEMELQRRHKLLAEKLQAIKDAEAERERARAAKLKALHEQKLKQVKTIEHLHKLNKDAEKETILMTSRVYAMVQERLMANADRLKAVRKERQTRETAHLRVEQERKKHLLETRAAALRRRISAKRAELQWEQDKNEILNIFCLGSACHSLGSQWEQRIAELEPHVRAETKKRGSQLEDSPDSPKRKSKRSSTKADGAPAVSGLLDEFRNATQHIADWLTSRGARIQFDAPTLTIKQNLPLRLPLAMTEKVKAVQQRYLEEMEAMERERHKAVSLLTMIRIKRLSRRQTRNSQYNRESMTLAGNHRGSATRFSVVTNFAEGDDRIERKSLRERSSVIKAKTLTLQRFSKISMSKPKSRTMEGDGPSRMITLDESAEQAGAQAIEDSTLLPGQLNLDQDTAEQNVSENRASISNSEVEVNALASQAEDSNEVSVPSNCELDVPDPAVDVPQVKDSNEAPEGDPTGHPPGDSAGDLTSVLTEGPATIAGDSLTEGPATNPDDGQEEQAEQPADEKVEGQDDEDLEKPGGDQTMQTISTRASTGNRVTLELQPVEVQQQIGDGSMEAEQLEHEDGLEDGLEDGESEYSSDEGSESEGDVSDYEPDVALQDVIINGDEPDEPEEAAEESPVPIPPRVVVMPESLDMNLKALEEVSGNLNSRWTELLCSPLSEQSACKGLDTMKTQIGILVEEVRVVGDFLRDCMHWTEGAPARAAAIFGDVLPASLFFVAQIASQALARGGVLSQLMDWFENTFTLAPEVIQAACDMKLRQVTELEGLMSDEFFEAGHQWVRRLYKALKGRLRLRHACAEALKWYLDTLEADDAVFDLAHMLQGIVEVHRFACAPQLKLVERPDKPPQSFGSKCLGAELDIEVYSFLERILVESPEASYCALLSWDASEDATNELEVGRIYAPSRRSSAGNDISSMKSLVGVTDFIGRARQGSKSSRTSSASGGEQQTLVDGSWRSSNDPQEGDSSLLSSRQSSKGPQQKSSKRLTMHKRKKGPKGGDRSASRSSQGSVTQGSVTSHNSSLKSSTSNLQANLTKSLSGVQAALQAHLSQAFNEDANSSADPSDPSRSVSTRLSKSDNFTQSLTQKKSDVRSAAKLVRGMTNAQKTATVNQSCSTQGKGRPGSSSGFNDSDPTSPTGQEKAELPARCTSVEVLDAEPEEREVMREVLTKANTVMLQRGKLPDGSCTADVMMLALQRPDAFKDFADDGHQSDAGSDDWRGAAKEILNKEDEEEEEFSYFEEGEEEEFGMDEPANLDISPGSLTKEETLQQSSQRSRIKGDLAASRGGEDPRHGSGPKVQRKLVDDDEHEGDTSRDLELNFDSYIGGDDQEGYHVRKDTGDGSVDQMSSHASYARTSVKKQRFSENEGRGSLDGDREPAGRKSIASLRGKRASMSAADLMQRIRQSQKNKGRSFLQSHSVLGVDVQEASHEDKGTSLLERRTTSFLDIASTLADLGGGQLGQMAQAALKSMHINEAGVHEELDDATVKAAGEYFGLHMEHPTIPKQHHSPNRSKTVPTKVGIGRSSPTDSLDSFHEMMAKKKMSTIRAGINSCFGSSGALSRGSVLHHARTSPAFTKNLNNLDFRVLGRHDDEEEVDLDEFQDLLWYKGRQRFSSAQLSAVLMAQRSNAGLAIAGSIKESPEEETSSWNLGGKNRQSTLSQKLRGPGDQSTLSRNLIGNDSQLSFDTSSPKELHESASQELQGVQEHYSGIWLNEESMLLAETERMLALDIALDPFEEKLQEYPSGIWLRPDGQLHLLRHVTRLISNGSKKGITENVQTRGILALALLIKQNPIGIWPSLPEKPIPESFPPSSEEVYKHIQQKKKRQLLSAEQSEEEPLAQSSGSESDYSEEDEPVVPATKNVEPPADSGASATEVSAEVGADSTSSRHGSQASAVLPAVPGAAPLPEDILSADPDPSSPDSASLLHSDSSRQALLHSDSSKGVFSMMSPNSSKHILSSDSSKMLRSLSTCSSKPRIEPEVKKTLPLKQWKLPRSLRVDSPEPVMDKVAGDKGSGERSLSGIVPGKSSVEISADKTLCSPLIPWLSQIKSRKEHMHTEWHERLENLDDSVNWTPQKQEHELMLLSSDNSYDRVKEKKLPGIGRAIDVEVDKSAVSAWISPLRRRVLGAPSVIVANSGFDHPLPNQDRGVLAYDTDRPRLLPKEPAPYRHGYQKTTIAHTRKPEESPHVNRFVTMTAKDKAALRRRRPLYGSAAI